MTPRLLYFRPQEDITIFEVAKVLEFLASEFPHNFPCFFGGGRTRLPFVIGGEDEWDLMQYMLRKYGIARHFHGVTPEDADDR